MKWLQLLLLSEICQKKMAKLNTYELKLKFVYISDFHQLFIGLDLEVRVFISNIQVKKHSELLLELYERLNDCMLCSLHPLRNIKWSINRRRPGQLIKTLLTINPYILHSRLKIAGED